MFTLMPVAAFAADEYVANQVYVSADAAGAQPAIAADTEIEVLCTRVFKAQVGASAEGYVFYAVDADNKGVAVTTTGAMSIKLPGDYQVFAVPAAADVVELIGNANDITKDETPATAVAKIQNALDDSIVKAYATVTVVAPEANYDVALDVNEVTVKADNGFTGNAVVKVTLTNNTKAVVGKAPEITAPDYVTVAPVKNTTTDANGSIKYNVSANRGGTFEVVFAYEDAVEETLTVNATDDVVANVELVKSATNAINKKPVGGEFNTGAVLKFTDINGSVKAVSGNANDAGLIANTAKVTVVSQPATSKLAGKNFALVTSAETGCYDLVVKTTTDLKVGSYEVKVALENGKSVTAKFEAAKMGDVVGIRFVDPATTVALGDELTAASFPVEAYDANGVVTALTNGHTATGAYYTVVAQGKALDTTTQIFKVINDEKYIGSTVTVLAKTGDNKFVATTEVEVVDAGQKVVYKNNTAEVGVTTKLVANVFDAKDNKVAVPAANVGNIKIVVLEKPAKAYVHAAATAINGKDIDVTFLASVAGEYKIQTIVLIGNNEYVSGIETITVGANADSFKDIVVMSIGATKFVVNNEVKEIPTAPVIENSRTFVPLRALVEAFGAEVNWDDATRSVTVVLDNTTVVMTIGSAEYTVNGVAKTMDVAPFINADNYTMVPVRFVAQAFGITPTPIADAETGAVVDVMFAK